MILASIFSAFIVGAASGATPMQTPACIDPATPLIKLALQYDRWPAPENGVQTKGFEMARDAMKSQKASAFGDAINQYRNMNTDALHSESEHVQLAVGILTMTGGDFNFDHTENYRHGRARYNTNAERTAADLFAKVTARDAKQWLPAIALTRMAILTRSANRFAQARTALQRVLNGDPDNVTARVAWRDILVAQDSSKAAFQYLNSLHIECAPVLHAQAENMMLVGDTAEGSRLYLHALDIAKPDELDRFYQDLLVMADRGELMKYDATPPDERSTWIRDFWERNAAIYGRSVETRVADETVRAAFADANFMHDRVQSIDPSPGAFIPDTALSIPWDIRGIMYVRHGAPLLRMRRADNCVGYEGWVYVTDGDPWVLGFSRECGPHDWVLEQKPKCGPEFLGVHKAPTGDEAITKALTRPDTMTVPEIYEVFARYDQRYADLGRYCMLVEAAAGIKPPPPLPHDYVLLEQKIAAERRHLVDSVRWGGTAFRQFMFDFKVDVDSWQFRDAEGNPEVAVMSRVPLAYLAPLGAFSKPKVSALNVTYTLIDSGGHPHQETARVDIPPDATGTAHLGYTLHDLTAGPADLHVLVMDPADTARGGQRTRHIETRAAVSGIDLSDVVLAEANVDGSISRGGAHLSPLPGNSVKVGDPIRLYFEMYGVPDGQEITETIHIIRTSKTGLSEMLGLFPGKKDERTVTMKDTGAAGVTARDLEVSGDLIPGEYDVEVTVSAGGSAVHRTARLKVSNPSD